MHAQTNQFNMPLLAVYGSNCFGETFIACVGLIGSETIDSQVWVFQKLLEISEVNASSVTTVITDGERGIEIRKFNDATFMILISYPSGLPVAIGRAFPLAATQLCVRHLEKNILHHCGQSRDTVVATK